MELVASDNAIRHVQSRGGAVYVWARKARCCGGAVTLEASTEPRRGTAFRRSLAGDVDIYLTAGMPDPTSLHLELSRSGRLRAFWDGLAWVA